MLFFVAFLLLLAASKQNTDILLALNEANFDKHIGSNQAFFVQFYSPSSWFYSTNGSKKCDSFARIWKTLASKVKSVQKDVRIATVDMDKNEKLINRHGLKQKADDFYLLFFAKKSKEFLNYPEGKILSVDELSKFISKEAKIQIKNKKSKSKIKLLNTKNFNKMIKKYKVNGLISLILLIDYLSLLLCSMVSG